MSAVRRIRKANRGPERVTSWRSEDITCDGARTLAAAVLYHAVYEARKGTLAARGWLAWNPWASSLAVGLGLPPGCLRDWVERLPRGRRVVRDHADHS